MTVHPKHLSCVFAFLIGASLANPLHAEDEQTPIAIAEVEHDGPVDFEKEILPVLTKNCLACHNASTAESELVLESPETILKGGSSGPSITPGKSGESLLLKAAAHIEEPFMPPPDNEVDAAALSSQQLGLIKRWIDEGAKGTVSGSAKIAWQPLPAGINPIFAVAVTPDGQLAACGRANQIFVYNLAFGQLITRLTDPALVESGVYKNQGVAHLDLVQSLAFSPDGNVLASGGYREVKLWRRPHGVRRAELATAGAAVLAIATSADGKWVATGEATGEIKLWDTATLKDPKTLAGHSAAVTSLQFLPDGAKLVSGSADKTIRLWNVADGAPIAQVETPAPVHALAVVADGAQAAAGGADHVIRLWTLPTEADAAIAPGAELSGHGGPITALVASPSDKSQLVSASEDGTIRVWNLADGKELRQINHGAAVTALAMRGDGQQISSAGADNLIKLWKAADGQPWEAGDKQPIAEMKGDFGAQFNVARFERVLALHTMQEADATKALADAEARIISTSQNVASTQTAKAEAAKALKEKQDALKAPADAKAAAEKELAAAQEAHKAAAETAAAAKAAVEKEADNADLVKANEEAAKAAADAEAKVKEGEKKVADTSAAFNNAQQEVTTAEAGNTAAEQAADAAVAAVKQAVNSVPAAQEKHKETETTLAATKTDLENSRQAAAAADKPIRALVYSADGSQLASAGDNGLVRLWASDNGTPIETFQGHPDAALCAAFLPDGSILSAGAGGSTFVWNATPDWTLERTIGNVDDPATFVDRVISLAFSRDGSLLATGGGEPSRSGQLKIYGVADGALVREIADAHSDTVFGLEFSPDDKHLASSAADRFVKVFDVASGSLVRSFEGHTHHVLGVTWKWDGKVLASCGADNVIKVWDFTTGDQQRTVGGFGKEITSLGFVAAQPQVLASSGDKTVRLANVDNGKIDRNYSGPTDFVYSTALSANGKLAIGGGQESTLYIWRVDDGGLIRSLPAPKAEEQQPQTAQAAGG